MHKSVVFLLFVVVAVQGNAPQQFEENEYDFQDYKNYLKEIIEEDFQHRNEMKMCRYRDEGLFPDSVWTWKTGGGCYFYFSPDWFTERLPLIEYTMTVGGEMYTFYISQFSEMPLTFDYTNHTYSEIIRKSFNSDDLFQKWVSCAVNADDCCRYEMDETNIHPSDSYPCPATWDAWTCFAPAERSTINEMPCPDYTSSSNETPCILYSEKECFANGTWNQQTEYATCAVAPVYRRRHNFHVIVLYVSIALCFPAVIIFSVYRNLRILRVNLHRNLLIACILRSTFAAMQKEIVILDSLKPVADANDVLNENGVACRVLAFFLSVATNAIYACMLADGIYLHKLIVRIFSPDPNVYILYGATAALSLIPTMIWAILLAVEADQYCWAVDSSWYQWIPDGFRIGILCINLILMLDIMRTLLSKLRKNVSAQHTKSTLKAMAFLIPLFGVPFIFTASRDIVDTSSCTAGDIYYYISYSIQALQGVMVAIVFCYWNKEVHGQIKRTYEKLKLRFDSRQMQDRRETAATYVRNSVAHQNRNHDFVEPRKKVEDWLTDVKAPEESTANSKTKGNGVQFSENLTVENHAEVIENDDPLSNRVSRFIDDETSENSYLKK